MTELVYRERKFTREANKGQNHRTTINQNIQQKKNSNSSKPDFKGAIKNCIHIFISRIFMQNTKKWEAIKYIVLLMYNIQTEMTNVS